MRYLYISLFLSVFALNTNAQIITTVAGDGIQGYSGDGGQATAAELYDPADMAFDGAGNMYIADRLNNVIRKVTTAGIMSTFAGNGTGGFAGDGGQATVAGLYNPTGVAFDAMGNLYIADQYNQRIRMVNTVGIISTFAGNGTPSYGGDGGEATAAALNYPLEITFDARGNAYIADGNNRIRMINTLGIINTFAGNGTAGFSGDGGAASLAELNGTTGIVCDAAGNFYIADRSNERIRIINTAGIINTFAGTGTAGYSGDGGVATAAELYIPGELALDAAGNLYISDGYNMRIRMVNMLGIITTIVGTGTGGFSGDGGAATAAELNEPRAVTFDAFGNLYIADANNNRIRMVTNIGNTTGSAQYANSNEQVTVYPNPTSSIINLAISQFDNLKMQEVEITNMLGEVVYHCQIATLPNYQIDVSDLNEGVYNLTISNQTEIINKRVVIVR